MPGITTRTLMALSFCGAFAIPAFAQVPDAGSAPSEATAPADSPAATDQPKNLGQGTKAQAEHSAEATAHKSLNDPNNQLGTSLQGRTRPIAQADESSQAGATTAEDAR